MTDRIGEFLTERKKQSTKRKQEKKRQKRNIDEKNVKSLIKIIENNPENFEELDSYNRKSFRRSMNEF